MEYMTSIEAAEKWGLSRRRVHTLCATGRIAGVTRLGSNWAIPADAEKPTDGRVKNGKYIGRAAERRKAKMDHRQEGV